MQFDDLKKAIAFSTQNPEATAEICLDPESLQEAIDQLGFNCRVTETSSGYQVEGWRKPVFGIAIEVEPSWGLTVVDVPF